MPDAADAPVPDCVPPAADAAVVAAALVEADAPPLFDATPVVSPPSLSVAFFAVECRLVDVVTTLMTVLVRVGVTVTVVLSSSSSSTGVVAWAVAAGAGFLAGSVGRKLAVMVSVPE